MAKPEWGAKRLCASCGERFYDLNRDPITCAECGAPFEVEVLTRGKRIRSVARAETIEKVVPADVDLVDDEEEAEDDADAVVLDDEAEDEDVVAPVVEDDDIDDADDVLLEDDEDDVADDLGDLVEEEPEDDLNR